MGASHQVWLLLAKICKVCTFSRLEKGRAFVIGINQVRESKEKEFDFAFPYLVSISVTRHVALTHFVLLSHNFTTMEGRRIHQNQNQHASNGS